jgi:hypothetical protein
MLTKMDQPQSVRKMDQSLAVHSPDAPLSVIESLKAESNWKNGTRTPEPGRRQSGRL